MAFKTPDYYMLIELRKHLVFVSEATKQLTGMKKKTQELENTLREIKYTNTHVAQEPEYSAHEKAARRQYQYQCEKAANERYHKKNHDHYEKQITTERSVKFWFVLATICGCVGLIGIVAFLWMKTKLGYAYFMDHLWEGIMPEWNGSLHIYAYALGSAIALSLAFWVLSSIKALGDINGFLFIVSTFIMVGGIIFTIVTGFVFIAQWWNVQGGWWALAWIPAFLAAFIIPIVFVAKVLLAALVSFIVFAVIAVIPVVLTIMWKSFKNVCCKLNPKVVRENAVVDEREFQKTEAYRRAVEKDKRDDPIKRSEYLEKVGIIRQGLVAQYTTLISAEKSVISMLENAIKKSNYAIAQCQINDMYKTISNVNCLLFYFEYDLAETVKEAANRLRDDLKMKQLVKLIGDGFTSVLNKLDHLDQSMRVLADQWNAFARQSERQHREIMGSMQRIEDQQDRVARYTRQAIKDAETSMTKSLGELKSTYVTSSNNAANRIAGEISSASDSVTNMLRILAY